MKHPKRFCVRCDEESYMVIKDYIKYAMYHCQRCNEEICRVGDGETIHNRKEVTKKSNRVAFLNNEELIRLMVARYNPDVLSSEQKLWQAEDEDAAFQKQMKLNAFKEAFSLLTFRQKQIVLAMQKYNTHIKAAQSLGVSRTLITNTMKIVQKKIKEHMSKRNKLAS